MAHFKVYSKKTLMDRFYARRHLIPYLLIAPGLALLVAFHLTPLINVVIVSFYTRELGGSMLPIFTLDNYIRFFTVPVYVTVLLNTMKMAFFTTISALILSYPLAYFIARAKKWRGIILLIVIVPFWVSILVRVYAWMLILQNNGIINNFLRFIGVIDQPIQLLYNMTGVIIGLTYTLIPFMVLPLYSVISGIDPSLEEAAKSLGANKTQVFLKIIFPLSMPGIAAGCLLVFIIGLASIVQPGLLGGAREMVFATLIQQQVGILNLPFASASAVILLLIVFLVLGITYKSLNIKKFLAGGLT